MTATVDAIPLARLIAEHAYKAGASLVTTLLYGRSIGAASLSSRFGRLRSTPLRRGSMKAWPRHSAAALLDWRSPATTLRCSRKQNPEHVSRVNRATSKAYRPALELIVRHEINWTIVANATPAWAAAVFPDLPQDEALGRLWDAIFAASRADQADPLAAWKEHDANLTCSRRAG